MTPHPGGSRPVGPGVVQWLGRRGFGRRGFGQWFGRQWLGHLGGRRWRGRRLVLAAAALPLLAGLLLLCDRSWLELKGAVAARRIEAALDRHLADGGTHRPWGWADHHPVARLEVARLGVRRPVLAGAAGASLAFGLGHLAGTPRPGAPGNAVVAGHRDTALAFAGDLRRGDAMLVTARAGSVTYRVREVAVVAADDAGVLAPAAGRRLTLVTCWPLDGLLPTPWRLVVVADETPERELDAGEAGAVAARL